MRREVPKFPSADVARFWRERITNARTRYREASSEFLRILEEKRRKAAATPEGLHEILKARFAEAEALSDYLEVLKTYTIVVRGPESESANSSYLRSSAQRQ
jgi:hypothetical protein